MPIKVNRIFDQGPPPTPAEAKAIAAYLREVNARMGIDKSAPDGKTEHPPWFVSSRTNTCL